MRWEVKLSSITGETAGSLTSSHLVTGLEFSPDGKWISVAVTHSRSPERPHNSLFVIPSSGVRRDSIFYQVPDRIIGGDVSSGIYWSPTSEHIVVDTRGAPTVLRLSDRSQSQCTVSAPKSLYHLGGFVDGLHFVMAQLNPPTRSGNLTINSTSISLYDMQCAAEMAWSFRGRIDFLATYPPSGAMAFAPDESEVRLVVGRTGAPLQRFRSSPGRTSLKFGASGQALCVGRYPSEGSLECFCTRTGELTAKHPSIKGGAPLDVSLNGFIMLATEGTIHYNPFTERERDEPKAWVVWNFRTGKELARLKCRMQRAGRAVGKGNEAIPFSTAISPDGRSIAMGGDDLVQMYDLPQ